eukprot:jgi/Chrzof1/888/Cz01g32230.t1
MRTWCLGRNSTKHRAILALHARFAVPAQLLPRLSDAKRSAAFAALQPLRQIDQRHVLLLFPLQATKAGPVALPALPPAVNKKDVVKNLLLAKEKSGKTFSQIAGEVELTNVYTAQLFYRQVSGSIVHLISELHNSFELTRHHTEAFSNYDSCCSTVEGYQSACRNHPCLPSSVIDRSNPQHDDLLPCLSLTDKHTKPMLCLLLQQQLQPNTVEALRKAVPTLSETDINEMTHAPYRSFDPNNIQEPLLYRLYEAIMHGGEGIKAIVNEEFGDGIMSAIGFYCEVDKMVGKEGEPRVIITLNGKFLPFVEQKVSDNVAHRK